MRVIGLMATAALLGTLGPAEAESRWLESGRLDVAEIGALCERVGDVRQLARMQMIASGDGRWRQLSRQELVVEGAVMGTPPLDPTRCYIVARAGPADEGERRAFEVRDFAVSADRTSAMIVGRGYEPPEARFALPRHPPARSDRGIQ